MHARDIRNRRRPQSRKITDNPRQRGPRELANYMTLRELGRGGAGVVYEAFHNTSKRRVALKCLAPQLSGVSAREALEEAAIGSALNNPRCVTVIDAFFDDASSSPVIVSELIDGLDLERILSSEWYRRGLESGTINLVDRLLICEQLLLGLLAAHNRGIVHRDIKPGNFLVPRETLTLLKERAAGKRPGESPLSPLRDEALVKLSDWGLSLIRNHEIPVSETLSFQLAQLPLSKHGGTLALISVEQIDGIGISRRTDLFALGLVFYQVLTGRPPEDARRSSEGLSEQALREPGRFLIEVAKSSATTAITELDPHLATRGIPNAIRRYLSHLARRNKDDRPSSQEALAALRGFIEAPPPLEKPRRFGWVLNWLVLAAAATAAFYFRQPLLKGLTWILDRLKAGLG